MFEIENIDLTLINFEEEEKAPEYPLPITVVSAEGCYLVDDTGKKYLDLTSNKENQPLGYSMSKPAHEPYLCNSELFNSYDLQELVYDFKDITGLDNSYFFSSQYEAQRFSVNLLQNYLHKTQKSKMLVSIGSQNYDIYSLNGIKNEIIPLNNCNALKTLLTRNIGAVIIEPAQINNGVNIAENEYLNLARELCNKNNALLVLDISSIAPLRLGERFLNYNEELKPDILIVSKGISNGMPFGAVITSDQISDLAPRNEAVRNLTLTYKQISKFINDYNNQDLVKIIASNAKYLEKSLNELAQYHITIADVQSYGMLFSIIVDISAYELAKKCFEKGIIFEVINSRTIKLSPPYTIGKEEIDKLITTLDDLFDKFAKYDRLK